MIPSAPGDPSKFRTDPDKLPRGGPGRLRRTIKFPLWKSPASIQEGLSGCGFFNFDQIGATILINFFRFGLSRLLFLLLFTTSVPADSFDTLRISWLNQLLAESASATSVANKANAVWHGKGGQVAMNTSPSNANFYLWSDLPLGTNSQNVVDTFKRLRSMAIAYALPGSSLAGNASLAAAISAGLDWMTANVYTTAATDPYSSWYDWEVAAPQAFNDTAVLIYATLTPTQINHYGAAVDHFGPEGVFSTTYNWDKLVGANTSNVVLVTLIRGILAKSNAKLTEGKTQLSKVFPYVTTADGFYLDGSYKFHGDTAYTGHYGLEQLRIVAKLVNFLKGSPWAITDPNLSNVYDWITHGFEPLIYNGALMDMSRGRVSSWSNHSEYDDGAVALAAIRNVALFAPPATAVSLNTFAAAPRLAAGQFHFSHMDRVTSFRSGFGFGLSMSSDRIVNFENLSNTSNLKGWFTGDGMTYLYVGVTDTQFTDDFWPTVDVYHLPGTTVEQTYVPQPGTTDQSWVGGAQVAGVYGVAGMALHPVASSSGSSTLKGKKSWFMLDKEVVCLGAGITCTSNNSVDTTVENRRLGAVPTANFHINGIVYSPVIGWNASLTSAKYCVLDGVGAYYFPGGATNLEASMVASSGSWTQIRPSDSDATVYTDHYLKLRFKHGVNPTNASYAYVILPGMTPSTASAYAQNPEITVLANTPTVQAVRKQSLGVLAANFWADSGGTADWITVNKAASVITLEADNQLTLGISDPTQNNTGTTMVTLNRAAARLVSADPGVTVIQLTPQIICTVEMAETKGKTLQVTFAPTTTEAVVNFTTTGSWTSPASVTAIQVECWGGGGAGGSALATSGGSVQNAGGGAGGAYARLNSYPVTLGTIYEVNVGMGGENNSNINDTTVAGGDSWLKLVNAPSAQILAKGGAGGASSIGNTQNHVGGTGSVVGSFGDMVYAGGSGTPGTASAPGVGGSGASTGGGESSAPGSGGNGAKSSGSQQAGGSGGHGKVVLTMALPTGALGLAESIAAWRQLHFSTAANLGTAADAADPDGDGISNTLEYIFGTSPTAANTSTLLLATSSGTNCVLTFTARSCTGTGYTGFVRHYMVEMTSNLSNASAWTALPSYADIIGNNQTLIIPQATSTATTFYRLKVWLR